MERYLHSISLLLLMVAIAVSLLEVLALATARYDLILSRRQAELISSNQELTNQAQEVLAKVKIDKEGEGRFTFSDEEGHSLSLLVSGREEERVITSFRSITEWKENRRIGNLIHTGETGEEQ